MNSFRNIIDRLPKWLLGKKGVQSLLLVITILCTVISIIEKNHFSLNEAQILYLFSGMAQVIGGIFGLTLTAYIFFVDKFQNSTVDDPILYDATVELLNEYFAMMKMLAKICGCVIILSIIGIIFLHKGWEIYSFLINETVVLFVIGIVYILYFGIKLLDPDKLDKEIKKMKNEAENYLKGGNTTKGDFTEFLKYYNKLEKILIDFAKACNKDLPDVKYRPLIIQSLQLLNRDEIINGQLVKEINELKIYRNGLVHGVDFDISQKICDRIKKYIMFLNLDIIYRKYGKESEEWRQVIAEIYDLTD